MRATRVLASTLTAIALVAGTSPPAWSGDDGTTATRRVIDLPRGWQPEGVTTDGTSLFAGSLKHGGIWRVNLETGRERILHRGRAGRVAVGIDHDRRRGLLWVAGGPTGMLRAHDARTGRIKARYAFGEGRFVNDVTVTRRAVYATDSTSNQLVVVPLPRRTDRLAPRSTARTLDLTGDFQVVPDAFNLNGIVRDGRWLLAVQSVNGKLFRINPRTGVTRELDVRNATLVNGDGLELRGDTLYVVRNRDNLVLALRLDDRLATAARSARITHSSLDVPTTVAAAQGALWAVNARFGTDPRPRTKYWITRLPLAR